jgi:hypothetical protein
MCSIIHASWMEDQAWKEEGRHVKELFFKKFEHHRWHLKQSQRS